MNFSMDIYKSVWVDKNKLQANIFKNYSYSINNKVTIIIIRKLYFTFLRPKLIFKTRDITN